MSRPVVVTIPHKLGKQEAARRLRTGFGKVRSTFRANILGQTATGTIDVDDDQVRLEVQLPWFLSLLADKAKALVRREGKLMLEKPSDRRPER